LKCYALAATLRARRDLLSERLVGDGLVPLDSALGRHTEAAHTLHFPKDRQWIDYGMGHLELLNRPEVYSHLHAWMRDEAWIGCSTKKKGPEGPFMFQLKP